MIGGAPIDRLPCYRVIVDVPAGTGGLEVRWTMHRNTLAGELARRGEETGGARGGEARGHLPVPGRHDAAGRALDHGGVIAQTAGRLRAATITCAGVPFTCSSCAIEAEEAGPAPLARNSGATRCAPSPTIRRQIMPIQLSATFDTRREAEMTVERLVQEFDLDRAAIFVAPEGEDNSAGEARAGSDGKAGQPSPEARDDSALRGGIAVTVEVADEATADRVRDAFGEFDAAGVVETDPA
jgi:hypothetical protein